MLFIRRQLHGVGIIIGFIYFYGVVLGGLYLLEEWVFGKQVPAWPLWQYALAPFALGAVALAIEWAFEPLSKRSANWHVSIPQWKKALFLLFLLFIAALYAFQNVLWPCTSC